MKKTFLFLCFLALFQTRFAQAVEFGYPVEGEPWYFIKSAFADTAPLAKGTWRVSQITVNGTRSRHFLLYQGGEEVLGRDIHGHRPLEVKVRHAWQGNQAYEIQALLENTKTKKTINLTQKLSSPVLKGYWNPDWKNYLALIVAEENGIERFNYPVQATIGIFANYLKSGDEIRVVKAERAGNDVAYTQIPSQVYDQVTWADQKILSVEEKDEKTGERIIRYHPTTSLSIAFLANLMPREKATYLVFYNNPAAPKPAYATDLKVLGAGEGQPIGKTIENSFYKVTLNKKSGVIYEITEKTSPRAQARNERFHPLESLPLFAAAHLDAHLGLGEPALCGSERTGLLFDPHHRPPPLLSAGPVQRDLSFLRERALHPRPDDDRRQREHVRPGAPQRRDRFQQESVQKCRLQNHGRPSRSDRPESHPDASRPRDHAPAGYTLGHFL